MSSVLPRDLQGISLNATDRCPTSCRCAAEPKVTSVTNGLFSMSPCTSWLRALRRYSVAAVLRSTPRPGGFHALPSRISCRMQRHI